MTAGIDHAAQRIDETTNTRERAWFESDALGGPRRFMIRHEPLTEPRGAVLLCPSLYVDRIRTYRIEVRVARALAAAGYVVQRFDYRGSGQSDGRSEDASYRSMLEDAQAALRAVRQDAAWPVGLSGFRWGALMAAAVSSEVPGAPLAFFDPVFDGRTYFREAFRSQAMSDMRGGHAQSGAKATDQMSQRGFADVLGFAVGSALYEQASRVRLPDLIAHPADLYLLAFGGEKGLKGKKAAVVDEIRERGTTVTLELLELAEAWWFIGTEPLPEAQIVDAVSGWLVRCLSSVATR